MPEPTRHDRRLRLLLIGTWLILAATTLALAYMGWLDSKEAAHLSPWRRHENAAFMAIRAFGFDPDYAALDKIGSDWRLLIARWTGMVVFTSALFITGVALLRSSVARFQAAVRRGHILVIGDHEIAGALVARALARKRSVTHISAEINRPEKAGRLITLPRSFGEDLLALGRAAAARRVIIAEKDLGASVEGALEAVSYLDKTKIPTHKIAVHLDDPITAERLHHAPGGVNLFAFSEAQAAARAVILRHPPFLLARRLEAKAIHILILGFGRLGQAVARDLVLNCLHADLGTPIITVIDDQVDGADFFHLHPEFTASCRLEVFPDLDDARLKSEENDGTPPVCAAYVCYPQSARALTVAIALRERSIRHDLIRGPIFVELRSGGPMRPKGGIAGLEARQIYSFGGLADDAVASLALEDDPDAAAKSVHRTYTALSGGLAPPWEALSEEMRVSNRRVVSHIPAKLASLGFDLEPWLQTLDRERQWPPALAPDEPLFRNEADRIAAAALEHERWMADRRVNGWSASAKKDVTRKEHDCLVPFDQLLDADQAYDFGVVDWLDQYLPRRPGGLRRLPK